ncbi:MAG TPA: diguanylate cyclase, partial [Accumulibacter sp.]|nr:diguanylate cyclase [Accumulibacter sp.]
LWTTIASGKKWHGYVKNLRKDGLFYWVYATVIPNVRGGVVVSYTSVRRKPSRRKINEMSDLYSKMLSQERAAQ